MSDTAQMTEERLALRIRDDQGAATDTYLPPERGGLKFLSAALDTYNIRDFSDYGRVEIRVDAHDSPHACSVTVVLQAVSGSI